MSETASFVYSNSAMESLKTDLTKIQTAAQASLDDLQGQKAVAEATLAEATNTYNKEMAIYEAAMVQFKKALAAYEEAMKAYNDAMTSFSKYTPPNPIPEGYVPPSPPTPPTPPVEPTPPSPDAMNAAKAALAAVEQSITQVTNDIECLNTLVDTITNISNQVMNTDQEAVHVLTNDFFKLYAFSGMQSTGNDVANAIINNSKAVKDGYDYINTENGRLFLDLFDDEKLNMPQFIELGKTIGTTALIALMQKQGWGAEAIYHAAHTVDSSVEYNNVKSTFKDFVNGNRQSPIHSDQSSNAQINNAMGAMNEDVTVFVDGKVQGTAALSALGINLDVMDVRSGAVAELTDAQAYTIVADDDPRAKQAGYMTQSTYNKILMWMTHEAGATGTDRFGVASVILNEIDLDGISHGASASTLDEAVNKALNFNQKWVENGDILGVEASNDIDGSLKKACKAVLDYALTGKRAFAQNVIYFYGGGTKDTGASLTSKFLAANI